MSKVRVFNLLSPIILRAPPAVLAHDDAHHEPPRDLSLEHGLNVDVDLAAVEYWRRRTSGLKFKRTGDVVILSCDSDPELSREEIARERRELERKRIAEGRAALERDRQQLADERAALDRARRR